MYRRWSARQPLSFLVPMSSLKETAERIKDLETAPETEIDVFIDGLERQME